MGIYICMLLVSFVFATEFFFFFFWLLKVCRRKKEGLGGDL